MSSRTRRLAKSTETRRNRLQRVHAEQHGRPVDQLELAERMHVGEGDRQVVDVGAADPHVPGDAYIRR